MHEPVRDRASLWIARRIPRRVVYWTLVRAHSDWSVANPTAICGTHVTVGDLADTYLETPHAE